MLSPIRRCLWLGLSAALILPAAPVRAQGDDQEPPAKVEEVIVVTASRTEQPLHEVPASMTVMSSEQIEEIPSDDYGDLLRNVPGLNVSQMSARDIQVTSRGATSSLATSQLVLLDGRTLYLDFFGFVMWDFLPVNTREIKQIEVVRGPGSAVWGANAMSGVINLITKSPKEMVGTSVLVGGGEFSTRLGSITHAGVRDKLGYKVSGGYFEQDPYDRPSGTIPGSAGPTNPTGTPYPPFTNQGTRQPKFDFRLDYDASVDTTWGLSTGWAATDGIIHSGIGPFDIDSGSRMAYLKADWTRRAAQVRFFVNDLDGDAVNLLTVDPLTLRPLDFGFESQTYHVEANNTSIVGGRHSLTYGVSARTTDFNLSIAPAAESRDEFGAYVQAELLLGDNVRWVIGGRWDNIDPIGTVYSPRTSVLISPPPNPTFRASFNRAFRAPSEINNFLSITIANQVTIPPITIPPGIVLVPAPTTVAFPVAALGNPDLTEEQLDAYEIGWVGTFRHGTTVTLSAYRNETEDSTDFFPAFFYSSAAPPPGWPLPPVVLDILALSGNPLPSGFTYRNIGKIVDKGVEFSFDTRPSPNWSLFFNYSWQDTPDVTGIAKVLLPNGSLVEAVNIPPENRANLGLAFDNGKYFINGNVNFTDDAFWTDVLDSRFWGPSASFTQVNLGVGVRLADDHVTLSVSAQNLFDEDVQQHVFGDLIARKVTAQARFDF